MVSRLIRRSGISVCLIADLLKWDCDIVYQIGIGQRPEEIDVMKEMWPNVEFIGCEPNPQIVETIKPIYLGEIHEVALSNYIGTSILYAKKRHKDGSSLFPHIMEHDHDRYMEYEVEVTTIDTLFPNGCKDKHVLLWMDCEGSELSAIKGGLNFIKDVEFINIEMTAKPPGTGWGDAVEVHKLLRSLGFFLQWQHTQRSSAGQCDCIYVRPHLFQEEFCSSPYSIIDYRKWENWIDE